MEKKKVAWIGTGVMGSQQAGHLAKHGYTVSAYTHRYEKLLELQQQFGIIPCKTIAEAVQDADYIFVMVGYPSDVKEVFCDRGGIFDSAKPGALAIDMTTSSPSLAQQLYEQGKEKGIRVMDAPVSGGDSGACNATLSIMVGGDEADFAEAMPLFECMGKNIILMGRQRTAHQGCQPDCRSRSNRRLHRGAGLCTEGRTGPAEDALRHRCRSRRQLAVDQHGSACAGRRFCTGLLHQALYQGYEDCAGGKPQERCRAGDAGHRFGSLRKDGAAGTGKRRNPGAHQILSKVKSLAIVCNRKRRRFSKKAPLFFVQFAQNRAKKGKGGLKKF